MYDERVSFCPTCDLRPSSSSRRRHSHEATKPSMRATALCALLMASVAAGGSHGEMHRLASQLNACAMGKTDVDVPALLEATDAFCGFLCRFGKFCGPSVGNVRGCMEKVENSRKSLRKRFPGSLASFQELLECEKPVHKPNAVLADPSAAMGLLWIRRGLQYWADVFEQQAEQLKKCPSKTCSLTEQCAIAYKRTVGPFHGWIRCAMRAGHAPTPCHAPSQKLSLRACVLAVAVVEHSAPPSR